MKNLKKLISASVLAGLLAACGADLDEPEPKAVLGPDAVTEEDNIDRLVIAAYAFLGNDHYSIPHSFWLTGNLRAGDAHKGGDGIDDVQWGHELSVFTGLKPDLSQLPRDFIDINNNQWVRWYAAVSRANAALSAMQAADVDEPAKEAELRFVRGIFYFWLKIHYKHIPIVPADALPAEVAQIGNRDMTDQETWQFIVDEFAFAANNLPAVQADVGRANKYSAQAFQAKALLFKAYVQDENHQVTSINQSELADVVSLTESIISSGEYALNEDYANNFLYEFENSKESVFSIQRSQQDGSQDGKGAFAFALNGPQAEIDGFYGCCGFHVPTDNFVNAFKTDATTGLPLFDSYNDSIYVYADPVDPRLDHTVAMEDKPVKYDSNVVHKGADWARKADQYGSHTSIKELELPSCNCLMKNGNNDVKPFTLTSMNTPILRYSDVLLMQAEALIEIGGNDNLEKARELINQLRARAKNSTDKLVAAGVQSNYKVEEYSQAFVDQDEARKALRWERRLELGLEGHRFFDLVRWGIAASWLNNSYFPTERERKVYLAGAEFSPGKHEYLPIPLEQIVLSRNGKEYVQNPGY
ncbi:tetratricopeptide repeat-containing SusD/RagB family protein [Catenovulum agarivorans DS-2]|uniref:Tetratricopeptide repeat-containing SusD/RagB family protein n=1 Tax=Catenovulum agarivorans DS-2 TaxID=1328313 RepID=W7QVY0_9ALTE|nr:RagB/SusD family nutrient uptake outer membrane protein [Catenovulum agarivorans]EWH11893.1 tetratricopeptide repeat-containing SusD/RagB family protein [Catenovulum agarivorans DS-2]